jgi:hypothetical protein
MEMITERKELEKRTETLVQDAAPSDLPPELCRYCDHGCEFAVSCLDCPFSRCLDEEPGGRKRYLKLRRDTEIARLHKNGGKAVRELASMFQISRRTVQRILQSRRNNSKNGNIG